MTRVSENSGKASLQYSLNKVKTKLEDLQLKGTTLKSIARPSDDPVSNVETLNLSSKISDNKQFNRNADYALLTLNVTEKALDQLTEIMMKAKEIAISQASDFYDGDIRKNISNEVIQLRRQALAIANKRVGQRFLFSGYKTLQKPFNEDGSYNGDRGHITTEVSKDFFVQSNLHGEEVFFTTGDTSNTMVHPLNQFPDMKNSPKHVPTSGDEEHKLDESGGVSRDLASVETKKIASDNKFHERNNIFAQLDGLIAALENNDAVLIQDLLPKFDDTISRMITLRTRVGSIENSIQNSKVHIESENIEHASRQSNLTDADVAELFADITRQQNVLKTTYQASNSVLNQTLLDFIR